MNSGVNVTKRAFIDGFLAGFGNIGQVYEPIVDGRHVIWESKQPLSKDAVLLTSKTSRRYKQNMRRKFRVRVLSGTAFGRVKLR